MALEQTSSYDDCWQHQPVRKRENFNVTHHGPIMNQAKMTTFYDLKY